MGWGYFPDYDEVGTVGKAAHHSRLLCNHCGAGGFRSAASMASDVAQDELRERLQEDFEPKKFKQLQDLVRRMKRKTKPGYSHHEMLLASFKTFDVEEDGTLDEREFFKGAV